MHTHKRNDDKLTADQYYLLEDKHKKMFVTFSNVLQEV